MKKFLMVLSLLGIGLIPASGQKIGLQLYSLRKQIPVDLPGVLAEIKKWGITELEGGSTYGLSTDEFNKLLKDNGLKVISTHAEYDELIKNPQIVIDRAKSFGATYVVCFWIPHNGNEFTFEDMKKATELFNKTGKLLKENGLTFCYHPHGYEFRPYENGTLFDYLIKNTAGNLNFEMDVFWVKHPGQDPVALLKKYPNRFLLMHLKDRKPGTPGNQNGQADVETNVVLGTGDVGIASIMEESRTAGVKHFFIEDESSRSEQQIPLSLAFLRSLR